MLKACAIFSFAGGALLLLVTFADGVDPASGITISIASLISGATLWAFGDVQEDVREIRNALVSRQKESGHVPSPGHFKETPRCPHCHNPNPARSKYCIQCGREL